ncbi:hypothetical protein EFZ10_12690 [Tatumella sp. TA1]|uniref:hypothetical protein n=1 Tax=Rosenbergiella collisarenosi TaxID=1544695 RepID=UPI0008F90628|nr:hypothetical protein [Rosenbergiella collisarenosi]MBT0721298.1 hypothetical protein [Rosenbergiella collisarenosi]QGX92408.1 hypothetical protein EFZ10_12690 [Tatumella sp. TA1]
MVIESGLKQKYVDDMIGEAVIVLLKSGGPITTTNLLSQLTDMALLSNDQDRADACNQGIMEIKQSISKNYEKRSHFLKQQSSLYETTNPLQPRHQYDTKH